MENKKLIYIVGGIAIIGIAYYLYKNRNKSTQNIEQPASDSKETLDQENKSAEDSKKQQSKSPELKKDKPKKPCKKSEGDDAKTYMTVCGKKPLLKKNRVMWQSCIDEQKAEEKKNCKPAFDGASDYFEIKSNMSGNITDNMDIF